MSWGIRQMSTKREREIVEREAVKRTVRRRDDNRCQARDMLPEKISDATARREWPRRCFGPKDVHEIIPRSAWRAGYLVVDNCTVLCRAHHDWVTDHPDAAHELGLHGYSYERPDLRPDNGDG